jgi:EAL domain-containing protein (putative c-di-GMP-specific phosphodiesterase class I)
MRYRSSMGALAGIDPLRVAVVDARGPARDAQRALRDALARRQLDVHYQPRFAAGGELVGAEALLRWRHPRHGLMRAGEFLPLAEDCGLTVPIGDRVLRTVCAQQASWLAGGLRVVPIAVNLSASQLAHGALLRSVRDVLQAYDLEPRLVELEVPARAVAGAADTALRTLRALRDLGVGLALDACTGARLAHARAPFQRVSIDRRVVAGVTTRADAAASAAALVVLAHARGLEVVAVGVGTREQHGWLRAQGCDVLQGHLLGAPAPAAELERTLR